MTRHDSIGFFWEDSPNTVARQMPPIPDTGWIPPKYLPNLSSAKVISIDLETYDPELLDRGPGWAKGVGHIVGVAVGADCGGRWYFPIRHEIEPEMNWDAEIVLMWLRRTLNNPKQPKVGANIIYDIGWLKQENVEVKGPLYDVQYAEALLNEASKFALEILGQKYLAEGKESNTLYQWCADYYGGVANGKQRKNIYRTPPRLTGPYAESDADLPLRIIEKQWPLLYKEGLLDIFLMECQLIPLYIEMRFAGVSVNIPYAEELCEYLKKKEVEFQAQLDKLVGFGVNVNAGKSLAKAFKILGVSHPLTEKGNPSFVKAFLEDLDHPLGDLIKEVRKHQQLSSTFVEGYILNSHVNGKVYGQFHPLRGEAGGTRSGRYSCVAEWTPIITKESIKRIDQIKVGDQIWTHKERWRKVTHTWLKGKEQMYDILFCNGEILTCTKSHKLLQYGETWITIGDLINACIEKVAKTSNEYNTSSRPVSKKRNINNGPNSREDGNTHRQYFGSFTNRYARSRIQSSKKDSLFAIEDRFKKSYERKKGSTTPQLYRGMRRSQRLLDYKRRRWCSSFCASSSDGRNAWFRSATRSIGCTPYRYRYEKQCTRQSCAMHIGRAQSYPLLAGEGQRFVEIKEINHRGCFEVYDITVEEDESYLSCGVYSHNSSTPNLQNIPSRDPILAPLIRGLFIPDIGHKAWLKFDYSQIEYRFLVHYAVGASGDAARRMFNDDPHMDYHKFAQDLVKEKTGMFIERKPIKNLNFGLIYGMGKKKMGKSLGLNRSKTKEIFDAYFAAVPFARDTMNAAMKEAQTTGVVTTILGRKSRFDLWEPSARRDTREALPLQQAILTYGSIQRAYTYKALNRKLQGSAADLMKKAMHQCYVDGVFDATGVPRLTVHDELDFSDPGGKDEAFLEMKHIMEQALPISVPIIADGETGPDWGHVKSID